MCSPFRWLMAASLLCVLSSDSSWASEKVSFPASSRYDGRYDGKALQLSGEFFRPEGKGPFPAVVLMHGCGGLSPNTRRALGKHADYLMRHGFAALNLDSFGPRGMSGGLVCKDRAASRAALHYRVQDAFDALAFLSARPDVDRRNIFQMGQSHGGTVSLRIADRANDVAVVGSEQKFRAAIAYYPWCGNRSKSVNLTIPLLVFGGARDDWAPAILCKALSSTGAEYRLVMYAAAAHSFDLEIKEQRYIGYLIGQDVPATRDSRKRMVEFLRSNLAPGSQDK